jgi:hypothetical protein
MQIRVNMAARVKSRASVGFCRCRTAVDFEVGLPAFLIGFKRLQPL